MAKPILLYSTNTRLAYNIAQRYYGGIHYAWCTPHFDATAFSAPTYGVPPSSSPSAIYHDLYAAVVAGDRHNAKIESNKLGILHGATVQKKAKVITARQQQEIIAIVAGAETMDFMPLLYVIPYALVAKIVQAVPVPQRAHPLSEEYIITRLPGHCFDVIELRRS